MVFISYREAHKLNGIVGEFIKSFAIRQGSPILSSYLDNGYKIKEEDIDNLKDMGYFNYKFNNDILSFMDHKIDSVFQRIVCIFCELNSTYIPNTINNIQDKLKYFFLHYTDNMKFGDFISRFNKEIVVPLLTNSIDLKKYNYSSKLEKCDIIRLYQELRQIQPYISDNWISILFLTNISRISAFTNGLL